MRKIVDVNTSTNGTVRLMIYNDENGTYLFGYEERNDCGSKWDEWYETENDALETCEAEYGILKSEWTEIPNPEMNCQNDWIKPVRVKGRESGNPEFGKLEKLIDGQWVEFSLTE